jgi:hypothetical protein
MKFKLSLIAATLCCAFVTGSALAALTAAEVDRLGKDLTPSGAEKAGNKEGTIPAWTGGLTKPPAGWQAEQGYVDPFADEKPLFTITAANAEQYKDKLSPGEMALLKKYPNFSMSVYPSHRTAALPQSVYDQAKAEATKISWTQGHIQGRDASNIPFPIPKNGEEAIHNHLLRYMGGGFERDYSWFPVRANGDTYRVGVTERMVFPKNFDPPQSGDLLFAFYAWYTAPATLEGQVYLIHDPVDQVKQSRSAWIYNAGLRRVRRAPDVAYDNIVDGTEGMRINDQYFGFNGATDRFDWKLSGKKEMYVPYNTYKVGDKKLKYTDVLDKNTIKSSLVRYELHRVWVIDATLKAGQKHIFAKRTFYLDEDSWVVLGEDAYDSRGQLWRVGLDGFQQQYDVLAPQQSFNVWHDLSNGDYIVHNLDNEVKHPIKYNLKAKWSDYQPDALRRAGTR